jgi:hypothetical protein
VNYADGQKPGVQLGKSGRKQKVKEFFEKERIAT